MDKKLVIALAVLILVAVAGAVLIALPPPTGNNGISKPFESERVRVSSPLPGATVPRTFTVTGEASAWYFEASFPLEVLDQNGTRVGVSYATAQGDWMTTDFVPFIGEITVNNYSGPATLVLHKDNASGLPEHDESVSFPIVVQ